MVDSEDEFHPGRLLRWSLLWQLGLGLIVLADWYDTSVIQSLDFFDENTRDWWEAVTGGANVPALNDLLAPFGAALGGNGVVSGKVARLPNVDMRSGTLLSGLPGGARALFAPSLAVYAVENQTFSGTRTDLLPCWACLTTERESRDIWRSDCVGQFGQQRWSLVFTLWKI